MVRWRICTPGNAACLIGCYSDHVYSECFLRWAVHLAIISILYILEPAISMVHGQLPIHPTCWSGSSSLSVAGAGCCLSECQRRIRRTDCTLAGWLPLLYQASTPSMHLPTTEALELGSAQWSGHAMSGRVVPSPLIESYLFVLFASVSSRKLDVT
jgi:hypothetical protein